MTHGYVGPLGFFPFGLLSGLAGLLFLAGIVVLIVWIIRELAGGTSWRHGFAATSAPPAGSPLDTLSRRLAAGEISAEEFQKVRDLLRENPKP